MKRFLCALLGVVMILAAVPFGLGGCADPLSEGLEYTSNGDGTCTLAGMGTFVGTALRVPERNPGGELVTAVEAFAFSGNGELVSVALPDSVKTLRTEAFSGCTSLEWVRFGNGLESIEAFAFKGCSALEYFTYSGGFGSITVTLDIAPFVGSLALQLKDADRYIPMSVQLLELPRSVKYVEAGAFSDCSSLSGCLLLGEGLQGVGANAFSGCTSLEYAHVDSSVLVMGNGVFEGDAGLYLVLERENVPSTWHENWQSAGSATNIAVRNSEWA